MYHPKLDEEVEMLALLGRQTTCFAEKFGTQQLTLHFKRRWQIVLRRLCSVCYSSWMCLGYPNNDHCAVYVWSHLALLWFTYYAVGTPLPCLLKSVVTAVYDQHFYGPNEIFHDTWSWGSTKSKKLVMILHIPYFIHQEPLHHQKMEFGISFLFIDELAPLSCTSQSAPKNGCQYWVSLVPSR